MALGTWPTGATGTSWLLEHVALGSTMTVQASITGYAEIDKLN